MTTNNPLLPQHFANTYQRELPELEALRKRVLVKVVITSACWLLLFAAVLAAITWLIWQPVFEEFRATNSYQLLLKGVGALLLLYVTALLLLRRIRRRIMHKHLSQGAYAMRYKNEVAYKALASLLRGATCQPEQGITVEEFSNSGFPLFGNPARYYSSGEVTGMVGKTVFRFAEVHAESFVREHDSPGQYADLFRGVFFIVDLQKLTTGHTLLYPDKVKYFSRLLLGKLSEEKYFSAQKFQRVKLEDVVFEKHFEVYGTDQVEARYLLSPALMSRLVTLTGASRKMIQFSFKNSKAYFGVYYQAGKDLFTVPLFTSVYNVRVLEKYAADIRSMMDIVKELNMNAHLM